MLFESVFSFSLNMQLAKTFGYGENSRVVFMFPNFRDLEELPAEPKRRALFQVFQSLELRVSLPTCAHS